MNRLIKILLVSILLSQSLFSDELLERVIINPLNRATFYYNAVPQYKATLSDDKKSLEITFEQTGFKNSFSDLTGKGVIERISAEKQGNQITARLQLGEKRGYNAVSLPFSKAVMVEFFKWEKLSQAEDAYRTALLSLETGNKTLAINDLQKAFKFGEANAAAMLGVIKLNDGNDAEALELLNYAEKNESNIPDFLAALGNYYKIHNDKAKANEYFKRFKDKTGIELGDPNAIAEVPKDTTAKDTTKKTMVGDTNNQNSFLPEFTFGKFVSSLGYVLFAFALLIVYYYFSWRKKQAQQLANSKNKETKIPFATPETQAPSQNYNRKQKDYVEKPKATNQRTNPNILNKTYGKLKPNKINQFTKDNLVVTPKPKEIKPNVVEETQNLQIEEFLKSYIPEKRKETQKDEEENVLKMLERALTKKNDTEPRPDLSHSVEKPAKEKPIKEQKQVTENTKDDLIANIQETTPKSKVTNLTEPKLDNEQKDAIVSFAMHLAEKQKNIKKQDLESLDSKSLPTDEAELNELAKEKGLDTGTLEIKKNLENTQEDNPLAAKLAEKFKAKK